MRAVRLDQTDVGAIYLVINTKLQWRLGRHVSSSLPVRSLQVITQLHWQNQIVIGREQIRPVIFSGGAPHKRLSVCCTRRQI